MELVDPSLVLSNVPNLRTLRPFFIFLYPVRVAPLRRGGVQRRDHPRGGFFPQSKQDAGGDGRGGADTLRGMRGVLIHGPKRSQTLRWKREQSINSVCQSVDDPVTKTHENTFFFLWMTQRGGTFYKVLSLISNRIMYFAPCGTWRRPPHHPDAVHSLRFSNFDASRHYGEVPPLQSPEKLLLVSKRSTADPMPADTPEARLAGWKKMCLLVGVSESKLVFTRVMPLNSLVLLSFLLSFQCDVYFKQSSNSTLR
jgi:hypothetical protein